MPELGIDFTILYPTNTLLTPAEDDPDLRRGLCAGFNAFYADVYGPFSDRMTTAGIVPMHTPDEAIAELHHMKQLGIKVACFPEGVLRPLSQPAGDTPSPWLFAGHGNGSTVSRSTACTTTTQFGRRVAISGSPSPSTVASMCVLVSTGRSRAMPPTTSVSSWPRCIRSARRW
jgi:hypothetical protein